LIEINVTEEHLKSRTFEMNPGQCDMKKWDRPERNEMNGNSTM
jgi:hypothetical protein